MSGFDNVIGYESIKTELKRYCDSLKHPEKYKKLGISMPSGVMLFGAPGLGKTTMGKAFTEESGRKVFSLRKVKPDGDFINEIAETFKRAKNEAPSIVFLDDLDKFANEDYQHPDAEEYVAVQAGIDDCRGHNVFVIATANTIDDFPDSLLRAGRFDKCIQIVNPTGEDAARIIEYYLSKKSIMDDTDIELICRLMEGRSCAELETVINEAGIYAGYEGREKIANEDFMRACFSMLYQELSPEAADTRIVMDRMREHNPYIQDVAVHELGHTLVAEVLDRGSVNAVTIMSEEFGKAGVTSIRRPKGYHFSIDHIENEIIQNLGGMAAVETILGKKDLGCSTDVGKATMSAKSLAGGYFSHAFFSQPSDRLKNRTETRAEMILDQYYEKARRIIAENRPLFNELLEELMEKKTLTYRDIARIREKVETR